MSKWEMVKLGDIYEITSSKRVFKADWTDKGIPFYRAREIAKLSVDGFIKNELFISKQLYDDYADKYGKPSAGDIMVTGVGTLGICYVVKYNDKFYFKDGNIIWLKRKSDVDSYYVKYAFTSKLVKEQISRNSSGTTVGTYTISNAKDTLIPLPPLEIQKQIAKTLDAAAELLAMRKKQLLELDNLIKSTFYDMFGDPAINEKEWGNGKIKDLAKKIQYGTSEKASMEKLSYPILRMNNITYEGNMDFSDMKYIDLTEKDKEKYLVHKGDMLFNRTNSKELVGKTAVYRENRPMAYAGYLVRLVPNEKANSEFISAFLNSVYGKKLLNKMAKNIVGMANINAQEMSNIEIYIPPVDLQTQFAKIVTKIEEQKALVKNAIDETQDLFDSLMSEYFE